MTSSLRTLKAQTSRLFPGMMAVYYNYRDTRRRNQELKVTPYGFKFAGIPAMQEGSFEGDEVALLQTLFERASVFVDVGAHVGFYSCLARRRGLQVIAVEPMPLNLELLYRNLVANDWADTEVFPVAASARAGLVTLYGGDTWASTLPGWAGSSATYNRVIPALPLDDVLGNRYVGQQLVIKADVEGAEFSLLQGARTTLARTPAPMWVMEVCLTENQPTGINPQFGAIFNEFWNHGYRAFTIEPEPYEVTPSDVEDWILNARRTRGYVNYLFCKPAP
jgi:FkbM family methyltransferase